VASELMSFLLAEYRTGFIDTFPRHTTASEREVTRLEKTERKAALSAPGKQKPGLSTARLHTQRTNLPPPSPLCRFLPRFHSSSTTASTTPCCPSPNTSLTQRARTQVTNTHAKVHARAQILLSSPARQEPGGTRGRKNRFV
jgi:hypothetical protein